MRAKEVIVLREVADDLNDGKAFYDSREVGVGDYFWDSLVADIESLILFGGIHRTEYGFSRKLASRFPYAIYYDLVGDRVRVVAVLPMRRSPLWILEKLRGRG